MKLAWLLSQFALCALLIARAGYVLSRSADRLADLHGWGRGWVGLALLATVTSLPELASGISAVAFVDAPNLAVGNALGACVVNIAFLVLVDALQRRQPMYRDASATHLLAAGFGVVMLGFVALSLLVGGRAPAVLNVGLYSPMLLGLYLLGLRSVHAHEREAQAALAAARALALSRAREAAGAEAREAGRGEVIDPGADEATEGPHAGASSQAHALAASTHAHDLSLHTEWRRFLMAAAVVVAAGLWLPEAGDGLARELGLSRSVVGTLFMALVTTLPEMAVTVSALRLGALDMAIGNLLGSNLFNVAVLAVDDLFYAQGPLLAGVAPVHAGTAVTALVMSGLVIIGLVMRPQGRVLRVVSWISIGLVAAYLLNAALIYLMSAD